MKVCLGGDFKYSFGNLRKGFARFEYQWFVRYNFNRVKG